MSLYDSALASVSKKSSPLHLIYDDILCMKQSKFRYRIWAGKDRFPVVLVNEADNHEPIRLSAKIATSLFSSRISKLVPYEDAPFYYLEAILPPRPKKVDPLYTYYQEEPNPEDSVIRLLAYEFDRTESEDGTKFWNPRARCVDKSFFNYFAGGPDIEL